MLDDCLCPLCSSQDEAADTSERTGYIVRLDGDFLQLDTGAFWLDRPCTSVQVGDLVHITFDLDSMTVGNIYKMNIHLTEQPVERTL